MHHLIPLGAGTEVLSEQAGRKAFTLDGLIRAGFPVPPGVVIPAAVFQTALSPYARRIHYAIDASDLSSPEAAHQVAERVAALLHGLALPVGLLEELAGALPSSPGSFYAVRSSALDEDGANSSFAGQYHTSLGVKTADLDAAILACWRSYFSPNAITARASHPNPSSAAVADPGMAILIQPLLDSEVAGVCFTVDPVHQRPDLLLVVSTWGLGAGAVDGTIPTDAARLRRFDLGLEESTIADKDVCLRADPAGGLRREPVLPAQRIIACLPQEWQERVAQFALAAEQQLGEPQDVEWCVSDGQVWLLQSRPITTLPEGVRQAVRFPVVWDNLEEPRHFWWLERDDGEEAGPLLPAELEAMQNNLRGGHDAVYYSGIPETRYRKTFHGRAYMSAAPSPHPPGHVRVYRAAQRGLLARLACEERTLWDLWGPEIVQATAGLDAFDPAAADGPALADHIEDAVAVAQRHWMLHTGSGPRPMRDPALRDAYARLAEISQAEAAAELPFLLAGGETIQTRLVESLYTLARLAALDPNAARAHVLDPASPVPPSLHDFPALLRRLLDIYGSRVCEQPIPGSPADLPLPWRETPAYIWELIAAYLPPAVQNPRAARLASLKASDERVASLCRSALDTGHDPAEIAAFQRILAYARRNALFLEEHNHHIDQLSEGQFYQALLYAGRWLAARGLLASSFDVYWLASAEVTAALRGSAAALDALVAERQRQFQTWQSLRAPACLGLPGAALPARPQQAAALQDAALQDAGPALPPGQLSGQPASRGRAAGPARICSSRFPPASLSAGDVLVAPFASPSLIPFLPVCAAVVLDLGGPGDHFAITARECAIPAVCATQRATRSIPEGAWVTVDADQGLVCWETVSPPPNAALGF